MQRSKKFLGQDDKITKRMTNTEICRSCGDKLIIRQTQKKSEQLKKAYYYTAYYYCAGCRKIYHDDKFKVVNNNLFGGERELKDNSFDAEIWTDGACVFNGQPNARAAWAYVIRRANNPEVIEGSGLITGSKQTNNVAEGTAILKAIEKSAEMNIRKIKIFTDSQISLHNLKKRSHMVKMNREIFEKIEDLIAKNNLHVRYEKVLGHSGDLNNERADALANNLAAYKKD